LQTPHSHIGQKSGCLRCAGLKKPTTEEFISIAKKIHRDKYDYSKVAYVNSYTNVVIICPAHGEFLQTPQSHINQKSGCSICSGKQKHTNESFIEKARRIHCDKYDYSLVDYVSRPAKVSIICKDHGEFSQTPSNHLYGYGCPHCKKSKGEELVAKILDGKKINYIKQKKFSDCVNPNTKFKLSYDFYLPRQNILIEYNGEQHYSSSYYYNKGGEERFASQQYRDSLKQSYAIKNGFNFLVIKYNEDIERKLNEFLNTNKDVRIIPDESSIIIST
jgi:hypothetical protein